MIVERRAASRADGSSAADGLERWQSFSGGAHYDPQWMGFGALRVLNEDRLAPGAGFVPCWRANMEVLTCVLSGALAHRDDSGAERVIQAGGLLWLGTGHGMRYRHCNASDAEPVHFLQAWLQPDRVNADPASAVREPTPGDGWQLLASPDGRDGSAAIRQDARVYRSELAQGTSAIRTLDPARRYWLHVATGAVRVDGRDLSAGDGLGFSVESGRLELAGAGAAPAALLWFELPA
ncbi:pirin family protein [Lysobacter sp. H21R4]|uniref:pirin family protein n=1 Tax=Lysobacter sp. H21R4 TaxID=2781021 RepID=UPI001888805E|nr:pirin family protein [Lysobacter sp. H21R4]QOY63074.1 pirin family protein [Lysobacter sp. H21R4]